MGAWRIDHGPDPAARAGAPSGDTAPTGGTSTGDAAATSRPAGADTARVGSTPAGGATAHHTPQPNTTHAEGTSTGRAPRSGGAPSGGAAATARTPTGDTAEAGRAPGGETPPVGEPRRDAKGSRGVVQVEAVGGTDLRVGQPDPGLLPLSLVARHSAEALRRYGPDALAYGANAGPLPARAELARWSAMTEGGIWGPRNVFVTAGGSHALELLCGTLAAPGDHVLVQRATYNLALALFRHHGLRPLPVGDDLCVPTGGELAAAVAAVRGAGGRVAFAYLLPTFHNPTGRTWSPAERTAVLAACRSAGVTIVEDDPYRELYFGASPPPPSLAAGGGRGAVIGVRTLSKVLAPGLRVGWVLAEPKLVERLERAPLFASGGGMAHVGALTAASLLGSAEFRAHLAEVRLRYRERRDALLRGLAPAREAGARWRPGEGGFFIWVRLTGGLLAADAEESARRAGTPVLNGALCRGDPGDDGDQYVRVSYSMHPPAILSTAGRALASAISEAARRSRSR